MPVARSLTIPVDMPSKSLFNQRRLPNPPKEVWSLTKLHVTYKIDTVEHHDLHNIPSKTD